MIKYLAVLAMTVSRAVNNAIGAVPELVPKVLRYTSEFADVNLQCIGEVQVDRNHCKLSFSNCEEARTISRQRFTDSRPTHIFFLDDTFDHFSSSGRTHSLEGSMPPLPLSVSFFFR